MKLSLRAVVLAAVVLAASACGTSHTTVRHRSFPTVSSSGFMLGGTVQCTATLTTPVQVGSALRVAFRFHNISKRTVNVDLVYGGMWIRVHSPDGTTYDTRFPLESLRGPRPRPTPIAPGATTAESLSLAVRWEGPLHITPGCGLTSLRAVRVVVTSPGPPADDRAAADEVIAASGHFLDHCPPLTPGVSVVGRLDPPSGDAPPMRARCSINLRRERGFDVAQVLIVTPPNLRGVHVNQTYQAVTGVNGGNRNAEAIAWQFVVTRRGATSVNSAESVTTRRSSGTAPDWEWTGSGWQGPGGSKCGGSGGGGGGVNGPLVSFVSACGR